MISIQRPLRMKVCKPTSTSASRNVHGIHGNKVDTQLMEIETAHHVNENADRKQQLCRKERHLSWHATGIWITLPHDAGYSARPMIRSITAIIQN